MRVTMTAAVLLLAVPMGATAAEGNAGADGGESAVWAPQELRFLYQGFTSHYSCDGLEAKVRTVLIELGARQDLTVRPSGCSSPFGVPDPFPAVAIKMNVLKPAGGTGTSSDAPTVAARWKSVQVRLDRDPVWEAGDCELLEQIKQKILPLFSTRAVDFASNCVPHQAYLGTRLAAELLFPDPKGDKALAAK